MAVVRFICGTQTLHKELERASREFLQSEDTILYSLLLRRQRRRLRGAVRRRGRDHLRRAQPRLDHRRHPAVQGRAVPLPQRRHGRPAKRSSRPPRTPALGGRSSSPTACSPWTATSPRSTRSATSPTSTARWCWSTTRHAVGFVGDGGRGTPELFGVMDRVDIITGTLGQGARRRLGRLRRRPPGDRRPAAPALPPLPVLQLRRAGGRRRLAARRSRSRRARARRAQGCGATPRCSAS